MAVRWAARRGSSQRTRLTNGPGHVARHAGAARSSSAISAAGKSGADLARFRHLDLMAHLRHGPDYTVRSGIRTPGLAAAS